MIDKLEYLIALARERNFGKAAALMAGVAQASGDFIVTMDADLQDDPAEVPEMLAKLLAGGPVGKKGRTAPFDIISGWKKERHDPWHKVFPSRVFNGMVSWLTGVKLHDHNCGLKIYRAEVFREVALYGELHRFVPVLAAARGFRTGEMVKEGERWSLTHSNGTHLQGGRAAGNRANRR